MGVASGSRDLISNVISFTSSQSAGTQLCCRWRSVKGAREAGNYVWIIECQSIKYKIPLVSLSGDQCRSVHLSSRWLKGQRAKRG